MIYILPRCRFYHRESCPYLYYKGPDYDSFTCYGFLRCPQVERSGVSLAMIFEKPTRSDIPWQETVSLLLGIGAIMKEGKGARVRFRCHDYSLHVHAHRTRGKSHSERRSGDDTGVFDRHRSCTMKNILQHKGYTGNVRFDQDDMLFYGRVMGMKKPISPMRARLLTIL